MRNLDQRILWAHGTPFIVRRVGSGGRWHTPTIYCVGALKRTAPPGYVIFAPCGKYLARVKRDQLKRWLNYFGLENLR